QVESSDCPGVDTVVDRLQQIWTHVVDNLTLSQEKAQRFANRRRRVGPRLRVGDLVWLSSRHIPLKVSSPKFKPRCIGPYRISEVINPVSFRLTLPDSFFIHNVFHRSLLRRYVAPMVPSVDPPAPVLVEGELEYIVEKILDSRVSRWKLQYLVKWKGYAQEDNSWVFASDVHAPDLVRAFHVAHPGRPGGSACLFVLLEALGRKGCTSVPLVRALCGDFLQKSGEDVSLQRRLWMRKLIMGSGHDEKKKNGSRGVIYKVPGLCLQENGAGKRGLRRHRFRQQEDQENGGGKESGGARERGRRRNERTIEMSKLCGDRWLRGLAVCSLSTDFLKKIESIQLSNRVLLASFDVVSLYTSINHERGLEAIDKMLEVGQYTPEGSVLTHYHTRLRPHTLPHEAASPHITSRGSVPTCYHTRLCPHTLPQEAVSPHITTRGSVPPHYYTRLHPHTLPHEALSPHITTRGFVLTHYHTRLCPHTLPHEALSPHITTQGSVPPHYHTRLRPHTLPHESLSPHITIRGSAPTHYNKQHFLSM
ncbi:unnamed protein product, partial [Ranitomeya imitator]